ncbi:hypothetical protein M9458_053379, partial [Cirrhinus mrigala]
MPSIAQLVERRTVGGALATLRSLVRRRLFFTRPPFLLRRPSQSRKRSLGWGGAKERSLTGNRTRAAA